MSRKPFVAGNWKMHGDREMATVLCADLRERAGSWQDIDVVVCPPSPYLLTAAGADGIGVGAQNICDQPGQGAYTGEVSGEMLIDAGCRYVIVGHSERRSHYGESDEVVATKTAAAVEAGLVPIVCVGETLDQREGGEMEAVLAMQLEAVMDRVGAEALENCVLAYEPVWAIGTGKTASPQQAQDVHAFLRQRVADRSDIIAAALRILYGGSVKPDNAAELFACNDVDGGLIGGASLDAESFAAICDAAQASI